MSLNGVWHLADFGISRYAEATTAQDTQKYAMSPHYAAPERWRSERATAAVDVYALGVIAFELIMGRRPFEGRSREELRDQHLHTPPPQLEDVTPALSALINECLYKSPGARPTPSNVQRRLEGIAQPAASPGLARLQEMNLAEVRRRSDEETEASANRSESEQRSELANAAEQVFIRISDQLKVVLTHAAPTADVTDNSQGAWKLTLGNAVIELGRIRRHERDAWESHARPAFDVICASSISLKIPQNRSGYGGRSHSLWYCDPVDAGAFMWFELAFMHSPLLRNSSLQDSFSVNPGKNAAEALGPAMGSIQLARPFTPLVIGDLEEFVDRWAGWFADAVGGTLSHPKSMPEGDPNGSWRRT